MIGRRNALIALTLLVVSPAFAGTGALRLGQTEVAIPTDAVVVNCPHGTVDAQREWVNRCIEVPYARASDDQNAISLDIVRSGWVFAGGAATQYWIERKLADGACELIYVTGMGPFALSDAEGRTAKSVIMFSYAPSGPCMARENAE